MTAIASRFDSRRAPCGRQSDGDQYVTEDMQGLVTEELKFTCGCTSSKEEFHDGSVHHLVLNHHGKVMVDEEFRGE